MLETILRNQRIILEVLRSGTDVTWLKEEIDERIHYTNEELSKLHQPTVSGAVCASPCCKGIPKHEVKIPSEFYCEECFKQNDR